MNNFCIKLQSISKNLVHEKCSHYKLKLGFTLAETLVTVGIIGVVAALTIPTIIANYQKDLVLTRMKHFYSEFNQALVTSKGKYGDVADWAFPQDYYDHEGSYVFWEKYIKPYMKSIREEKNVTTVWPTTGVEITLPDGSAFNLAGVWITYYPDANKKDRNHIARNSFVFVIDKNKASMIPFSMDENITVSTSTCSQITNPDQQRDCAYLIVKNGWQFPEGYPW